MTKAQKEFSAQFFKDNPNITALYLNPQGEWFTDINYANNSLPRNKEGGRDGKVETVKKGQKIETVDDEEQTK